MNLSDRTVHRNQNDWNKFYRTSKIVTKPVDKITTDDIENFFYNCISEYGLTKL